MGTSRRPLRSKKKRSPLLQRRTNSGRVHGKTARSIGKDPNYAKVHAMVQGQHTHRARGVRLREIKHLLGKTKFAEHRARKEEEIVRYQSSLTQWNQEARSLHRSPKRWYAQPRAPDTAETGPTKPTATRRCPKRVGKHGKVQFDLRGADNDQS